jgi:hypothetical protein
MAIRVTVERVCENDGQVTVDQGERYSLIVPNNVRSGHVSNLVVETVERIQEQS